MEIGFTYVGGGEFTILVGKTLAKDCTRLLMREWTKKWI